MPPRTALAALATVALAACASPAAPTDASAPEDVFATDVGRDAPAAPRDAALGYDPSVFDCRAAGAPARTSLAPLGCATDPSCTGMRLASSHRGAGAPGGLTPENTLSGIRAAIAFGADLVEMDVRATRDGHLVLMHDDTVDRTTQGTGPLADLTLAEVQALALDVAAFDGDFGCEHVPTFADALALAADRIVIVVDASKTDRYDLLAADVVAAGALDRVVFDDADPAHVRAALAIEPGLHFLVRATTQAELDARLAALAPRTPDYVHIDDADPTVMAPIVHAAGYRVFALGFLQDVAALRGDTAGYERLFGAGVDMIQSNRIDLLGDFLGR
ncbi:MAG: glycerophosphodiester phosphodiesterase family protein [Sandaracinus sp.]